MKREIANELKELGLNDSEVKVYIALTQLGEAPASKIAKKIDLPRTTVISVLEKLKVENLISTHKYRRVTSYWIESPNVFKELLLSKAKIAENLASALVGLYRSEAHFPFAEVHDTKSSIRKFIEKTLSSLDRKDTIYTIDVPNEGNYAKIYSENIENVILGQKKKKDILTKTLIPYGSYKNIDINRLRMQNIVLRELPKGIDFEASVWIVKNTLVHFSGNPPFIVALQHDNIVHGMKGVYDYLWTIATPVK